MKRPNNLISTFESSIGETERLLDNVVSEKVDLKKRLESAESQLAEISQQRDAGERIEMGLRWRLTKLESELQEKQNEGAQVWLKDWALGRAEALEDLFSQTGMDLNVLIARAGESSWVRAVPSSLPARKPATPRPPMKSPTRSNGWPRCRRWRAHCRSARRSITTA